MEEVLKNIRRFESAVSRAWSLDTEDSFTDRDRKATKEAYEQIKVCREELIASIQVLVA